MHSKSPARLLNTDCFACRLLMLKRSVKPRVRISIFLRGINRSGANCVTPFDNLFRVF